ncbi:MAG: hypothetical protein OHK0031_01620 [Anaerolineales bacterium]
MQKNKEREIRLRQELNRFLEILRQDESAKQVVLFGSLSSGAIHEWSDLDLLIVQETDEPFLRRVRLLRRKLQPQVAADLLVYTPQEIQQMKKGHPFLEQEILKKGQILYER